MRLKRNVFTIIFAAVFVLVMLLGFMHLAAVAYGQFVADGTQWIFIAAMVIAILLLFIGCFFLREKASLRTIQEEKAGFIIVEGLLCVGLIGYLFYDRMSDSIESALWVSGCLLIIYAICRILGGRLCAVAGLVITFFLYLMVFSNGWYVYSQDDMINVYTFLVPYFVFLLMTNYVIPQFASKSAIVVCTLIVMALIFGTAVAINPISVVMVIGCVIALLFSKIRSVDTTVTKGPVMAVVLLVLSAGAVFGMSILLEKDIMSMFSFSYEPGFSDSMASGDFLMYSVDKINDMLVVLQNSFDYALFPVFLFILAAVGGVAAIIRKLSKIGPMLLSMVAVSVGHVISGTPGSGCFYLYFWLGLFAAYGFFFLLLPEFYSRYEEEDGSDMFETDDVPSISEMQPIQEKVADENVRSSASDSSSVSEAAEDVTDKNVPGPDVPGVGVNMKTPSSNIPPTDATKEGGEYANFQEWHVSEEFVREDKLKKERQAARERSYQMAKEREAAKAAGEEVPEFVPLPEPTMEDIEKEKPERVVYVEQEVGNAHAPVAPAVHQDKPDEPQYNVVAGNTSDSEQSVHSAFKPDSDTIIMSGYQNSTSDTPSTDVLMGDYPIEPSTDILTADSPASPSEDLLKKTASVMPTNSSRDDTEQLLTAINDTEVPTVQIPDDPSESFNRIEVQPDTNTENTAADAAAEDIALEAARKEFVQNDVSGSLQPGEDEQLDDLLNRLDMSDSIKRMSESAREDMADVIEQEDDKTEDEVVLNSRDFNFGADDGEYGEVPTISDLEDKWRAEAEIGSGDEAVPDVLSAAELETASATEADATPSEDNAGSDGMMGFDFTGFGFGEAEPESGGEEDLSSTLSAGVGLSDSPASTLDTEESSSSTVYGGYGYESDDTSSLEDTLTAMETNEVPAPDPMLTLENIKSYAYESFSVPPLPDTPAPEGSYEPVAPAEEMTPEEPVEEIQPVESLEETQPVDTAEEIQSVESFDDLQPIDLSPIEPVTETAPEPIDLSPIEPVAETAPQPIDLSPIEPVAETAPQSIDLSPIEPVTETAPEEPATEAVHEPQEAFVSFMDMAKDVSTPNVRKFEPERISRTTPQPVVNRTKESPVYSFTSRDMTIDMGEDESHLGIPKPGYGRQAASSASPTRSYRNNGIVSASVLDDYDREEKPKQIHTEEVVAHSGTGSRSYHKIIIS